jgi:hypothetical protein
MSAVRERSEDVPNIESAVDVLTEFSQVYAKSWMRRLILGGKTRGNPSLPNSSKASMA